MNWRSMPLQKVFAETNSSPNGLSSDEVLARQKKFGLNTLPQEKPYSKIRLFFSQFNTPLMYILLATALISFLLKHYSDTIFIIIVLFINTTVGFYQENKANQSIRLLKRGLKIKARVLRDNNEKEIDSEELVAGDIVILKAGDKVPADGRIFESRGLKINEASLTGEWWAIEKKPTELKEDAAVADRVNMVFKGTIVEEGWAKIIITTIGLQTEIGKIVFLLKETKEGKTPLQKKITNFSKLIGAFVLSIICIIIILGYFRGQTFSDIFIAALALAVSAIPAGLLPAITVILTLGMRRILKENGLVRKLVANETLGSVTVICTDKTGTLTEGKMQVSHILTNTTELMRDGTGAFSKIKNINGAESHITALKIAVLATDAFIENPEAELEEWIVRGRPTEQALLLAGTQAGLNKKELEKQYPVIDKINFSSDLKYSAALHKINEKENILYVIGAPEEIIAHSADLDIDGKKEKLGTQESHKLISKLDELTSKGLRVIACAYKNYEYKTKYDDLNELIKELTLTGFIALKDPLRPDAKEAIDVAKKAGIRTVIVTGDHKLTAKTIAQEMGLDDQEKNILEGKEMEKMSDEELRESSKHISIYARVSPHHKLRIVDALQANGEIVAMLGDGVNDAPALKSADIGIAVGSGTDITKEVADLVLLGDNFKTIIKAIEQGRVILSNIRKIIVYLTADDFSELFIFLANMALGLPLPLLPAQILWINLVEDGFPDIALTTEQESEGIMEEKPRRLKEPILDRPLKVWMTAIFFISGIMAFLSFLFFWKLTGDINKARTLLFALMAFDSLLFAFNVRSFKKTIFRKDIFSNRYLVGAVIIGLLLLISAIYVPFLQKILGTQSMTFYEWLIIAGLGLVETTLIAFSKKRIFFRGGQKPSTHSTSSELIVSKVKPSTPCF